MISRYWTKFTTWLRAQCKPVMLGWYFLVFVISIVMSVCHHPMTDATHWFIWKNAFLTWGILIVTAIVYFPLFDFVFKREPKCNCDCHDETDC